MDVRFEQLQIWLRDVAGLQAFTIAPASSDASFRRYFRVSQTDGVNYIVMDAPPEQENCEAFVAIAHALAGLGLHVPRLHEVDLARGFILLSDLGATHYLQALNEATVESLYGDALEALQRLQGAPLAGAALPDYDRALLLREMALFPEWLLGRHLALRLDDHWQRVLMDTFEFLVDSALSQPRVWVHRDYHSRNLMVTGQDNPGVLDFQDAVLGPVTYDVVSLLRDCYVRWPRERVVGWAEDYLLKAQTRGRLRDVPTRQFITWFDLMGVQRHLKAMGIFARLHHRDGKPGYLADIPRTLSYVTEVAADYAPLRPLHALLQEQVVPRFPTTV